MFIAPALAVAATVREFIMSVLLVPSLVSVLWMTAFGGTAIELVSSGVSAIADAPLELKLFAMLGEPAACTRSPPSSASCW